MGGGGGEGIFVGLSGEVYILNLLQTYRLVYCILVKEITLIGC